MSPAERALLAPPTQQYVQSDSKRKRRYDHPVVPAQQRQSSLQACPEVGWHTPEFSNCSRRRTPTPEPALLARVLVTGAGTVWLVTDGQGTLVACESRAVALAHAEDVRVARSEELRTHVTSVTVVERAVLTHVESVVCDPESGPPPIDESGLRKLLANGSLISAERLFGPQADLSFDDLIAVHLDGHLYLPELQFRDGEPLEGFSEVVRVFRSGGWGDRRILAWFYDTSGSDEPGRGARLAALDNLPLLRALITADLWPAPLPAQDGLR